jgi:hypothetical protein
MEKRGAAGECSVKEKGRAATSLSLAGEGRSASVVAAAERFLDFSLLFEGKGRLQGEKGFRFLRFFFYGFRVFLLPSKIPPLPSFFHCILVFIKKKCH